LVTSEPKFLKGIEVNEVEIVAPVHESFGEPCCPDEWVDYEGKPSRLGDAV
jgi:hypothetical protein